MVATKHCVASQPEDPVSMEQDDAESDGGSAGSGGSGRGWKPSRMPDVHMWVRAALCVGCLLHSPRVRVCSGAQEQGAAADAWAEWSH